MKQYNAREFEQLLTRNGFVCTRTSGGHMIWQRGKNTIVVARHSLNFMICKRLIKEYQLT